MKRNARDPEIEDELPCLYLRHGSYTTTSANRGEHTRISTRVDSVARRVC